MEYALYIASVLGAVALFLLMPRAGLNTAKAGGLLGAATLGGLWLWLSRSLPENLGIARPAFLYHYVFSAIAIVAAVRVITHGKPVYSALWFVMVILSTAGLLLTLGAEFMAFAMVIIYGGAILVTYVFVIMLAARADEPRSVSDVPAYDRVSRDPAGAIFAGFVLLAVLLRVLFEPGIAPAALPETRTDRYIIDNVLTDRPDAKVAAKLGGQDIPAGAFPVAQPERLYNVERVGLDLFEGHPLGLELAGVILLISLVGAVVIARKQVEDEGHTAPAPPGAGGATAHPTADPGPKAPQTLDADHRGPVGT